MGWKLTAFDDCVRIFRVSGRERRVHPKAQPAMEQRGALIMIDGRNGIGHYVAAGATEAVSCSGTGIRRRYCVGAQ